MVDFYKIILWGLENAASKILVKMIKVKMNFGFGYLHTTYS